MINAGIKDSLTSDTDGNSCRSLQHHEDVSASGCVRQGGWEEWDKVFPLHDQQSEVIIFDCREIVLGQLLGKGGFCEVYKIKGFCQIKPLIADAKFRFIAMPDEYAVKALRRQVASLADDAKAKREAVLDLLCEAKILSQIDHPYIIRLQGIITGPSCSVILDRLTDTLQDRIIQWEKRSKQQCKPWNVLKADANHRRYKFLHERLAHASHIASALVYLHQRRIVHRDVKPSNVGFDPLGTCKLFDFGLARQLTKETPFLVTVCGSPRYMSPEVIRSNPYNECCDVYSFSLIVWEMVMCRRVFANANCMDELQFRMTIVNERPSLDDKVWSSACPLLANLVQQGWQTHPQSRPTMDQLQQRLELYSYHIG